MDRPTNLTQADHQRLQAIEARLAALEAARPEPTPVVKTLTAEQSAMLASMATYLDDTQLAEVRARMLAGD